MKRTFTIFLTLTVLMILSVSAQLNVGAEQAAPLQDKSNSIGNVSAGCEKIIFSSARDSGFGNCDIVLMNPDGTGKVGLLKVKIMKRILQ